MLPALHRIFPIVALFGLILSPVRAEDTKPAESVTAAAALKRLKEGNARFVAGKPAAKDLAQRRTETAKGQKPFAVVLTCADSRVSPDLVFDQGIGDVFVLRVAGNVTDPALLGSIEFAVEQMHCPLVVVLGHEKCGAVAAAIDGGFVRGNLGELIKKVHVGDKLPKEKDAAVAAGVRANVLYHAGEMTRRSTTLKDFVTAGRVQIVSGVYALDSGKVEWLAAPGADPARPPKDEKSSPVVSPSVVIVESGCDSGRTRRGRLGRRCR